MTPQALHVAIVTYNARTYIGDCIQSIFDNVPDTLKLSIAIVDNASRDGTVEFILEHFPDVDVIASDVNAGFAKSTNIALLQRQADYYLVLNPDTVILSGSISTTLTEMQGAARVGVAGCKLIRQDGSIDHACKRALPTVASAVSYALDRVGLPMRSKYLAPDVHNDCVSAVEAINGAFMLIRADALAEVGLLDERYWMYAEDLDWCRRFADAGWTVLYVGTTSAVHLKGAASGNKRPLKLNWHFHRSMALYYKKFDANHSILVDALVYAAIYGRFALSAAISGLSRLYKRVWPSVT